ncbi:MAG: PIN domain-containing protein [Anaerolineales bacterium]|nr:PIN domain-containing protein [Anaerolineales bacterium]
MPGRYVLDTNILTGLLRSEPGLISRVDQAAADQAEFLLCPVVFYEIMRGLLHRDAKKQMQLFLDYTRGFTSDDFNQADWQQAAHLWADLRRQGRQISDADLLIGVYALQRQAVIITDNQKDFESLGLNTENWRR